MRPTRSSITGAIACALFLSACASGGASTASSSTSAAPSDGLVSASAARLDRSVLEGEPLRSPEFRTAYDAVYRLRRNWLIDRGPERVDGGQTHLVVYLDDMRMGGPDYLKDIPINGVESIRFINGTAAFARWGEGHERGVIEVKMLPAARRPR